MKEGMKTFLHIFGGVIFGAGVSGIVTYKLTEKKFLKVSDERVKSLEEYIEQLQMERLNRDLGYDKASDDSDVSDDADISKTKKESGDGYSSDERVKPYQEKKPDGTIYTRYSRISNGNKSAVDERYEQIAAEMEHPMDDGEDDEYPMTEAEKEYERANRESEAWSEKVNSASPPRVIDYADFGKSGYLDEVTLYYYAGDNTLVTEDEQIIPSPEEILGDCLETSGFKTNTQKDLYVRNYRRSTDYEISKIFQKYSDKDIY